MELASLQWILAVQGNRIFRPARKIRKTFAHSSPFVLRFTRDYIYVQISLLMVDVARVMSRFRLNATYIPRDVSHWYSAVVFYLRCYFFEKQTLEDYSFDWRIDERETRRHVVPFLY